MSMPNRTFSVKIFRTGSLHCRRTQSMLATVRDTCWLPPTLVDVRQATSQSASISQLPILILNSMHVRTHIHATDNHCVSKQTAYRHLTRTYCHAICVRERFSCSVRYDQNIKHVPVDVESKLLLFCCDVHQPTKC